MKPKDVLQLVFNTMKYKRLRTILTILGIMIGPAAIVALLSITQGYGAAVTSQLAKIGVTTIYIVPTRGLNLTPSVVARLGTLANVTAVLPYYSFTGTVSDNPNQSITVYAIDTSRLLSVVPSLSLALGSVPTGSGAGAAIGYTVAYPNTTGVSNVSLGKIVTVKISKSSTGGFTVGASRSSGSSSTTHAFSVSGVYSKFGQGFFLNPDTSIFVPVSEGKALAQSSNYTGVFVEAKNASTVSNVVAELSNELGTGARVSSVSSILGSITSIEASASTLLIAIAGISFVVAFMSIMTTMFTSVTERTREIGVLKALGFTSRQILVLFVCESLVIGLIGGTIGACTGAVVGYFGAPLLTGSFGARSTTATTSTAVRSTTSAGGFGGSGGGASFGGGSGASSFGGLSSSTISISISPTLVIEVILLTAFMGAIAGLLPAWRASRLVPADALRSL